MSQGIGASFMMGEILFIDDCSSDKSAEICEKYRASNSCVKLIKQKQNRGVSFVRNLGINQAQGKYILFVDSDDFVDLNYLKVIDEILTKNNYDLLAFGHYDYITLKNGNVTTSTSLLNYNIDVQQPTEVDWESFFLKTFFASPCNKVFKTEILREKQIRFDTSCVCYEDYLFNVNYCKWINTFKVIDVPLYFYRTNEQVIPSLKRKWGQRFWVSQKVAKETEDFIMSQHGKGNLYSIRRYTYMAYMVELQYTYYSAKSTFYKAVVEVCSDIKFNKAVQSIVPDGKYLKILKFALKYNLFHIADMLLRYMVRRI